MILSLGYLKRLSRTKGVLSKHDTAFSCLLIFVLLNALLTALSRVKLGIEVALAGRYTPISVYLWIVLGLIYIDRAKIVRFVMIPLLFIITAAAVLYIKPIVDGQVGLLGNVEAIRAGRTVHNLYFFPEQAAEGVSILKEKKLSFYKQAR